MTIRSAVVHLLPPGGGLRALTELSLRSSDYLSYDLFTVDLGAFDSFPDLDTSRLEAGAGEVVREPLGGPVSRLGPRVLGPLRLPTLWHAVEDAERRLAARIDAGGYDVVLVHNHRFWAAPSVLHHLRTPALYYCQEPRRQSYEFALDPLRRFDSTPPGPRRELALAAVTWAETRLRERDRRNARSSSRIMCNSRYSAEAVARAYGRRGHIVPLGAELGAGGLPEGAPRGAHVVSVGAVTPAKGHDLVVEAIGCLPAERRPRLVIPHERSDPAYRSRLHSLAASRGVALDLREGVSDAALRDLYASAVATVCAAHLEPLGLSVAESLAAGTPVVAVAEGGFRETVEDGVNGLLVERDAAALAGALERLMAGPPMFDPVELARRAADRFDWSVGVDRYVANVAEVVGRVTTAKKTR
ncbi:MAG: glycosyltransferase family 4 protein [Microthrixaceae bacterium]